VSSSGGFTTENTGVTRGGTEKKEEGKKEAKQGATKVAPRSGDWVCHSQSRWSSEKNKIVLV